MSLVQRAHRCPICEWEYSEFEVRNMISGVRACVRCDILLRRCPVVAHDRDDVCTMHGEQLKVAPCDEPLASYVHALTRAVNRHDLPSITSTLRSALMNGHGQRTLHAIRSLDKYPIVLGYAAAVVASVTRREPWMDVVFRAGLALIVQFGASVPPTFVADTLACMLRAAVFHGGDDKVCPTARVLVREAYMLSERTTQPDVRRAIQAVFEGIDQHALMQMGFARSPPLELLAQTLKFPLAIGDDGKIRPKEAPMSETKADPRSNEKTTPPTRADQALAAVKAAAESAGKTLAAEGKAAAWQATTEQVAKRFHKRVLAKLQARGVNGGVLALVQEVMQTRVGLGIFSFLTGSGMSMVPRLQRKPLYARGASEMRTLGMRILFGEVLDPIADLFEEVWDEVSAEVDTWPEDDESPGAA